MEHKKYNFLKLNIFCLILILELLEKLYYFKQTYTFLKQKYFILTSIETMK